VGSAGAGMVSGYLTPIPAEWQTALGGTAAAGQCCIPITIRTSSGPSPSVFTPPPAALSGSVAAKQLIGYPLDRPLPAQFNLATYIPGAVIPAGFRSVLFVGSLGSN